jgi:hypothetical protein
MNTLFIFLFVIASAILAFYFFSISKKQQAKKRKIQQAIIDARNQKESIPVLPAQNKWLYPTDSFGMLEKGVVYETKTSSLMVFSCTRIYYFICIDVIIKCFRSWR